ncbi:MAG: glycosyltransferase family 1 protein [Ferruginibacter sp.]|nr:glycosyltransferase family 1 protein [Ferruginibacter sp.]
MKIVFFVHPEFLESQSMPRFAAMLSEGMRQRGHEVEVLAPKPFFFRLPTPQKFKKWLGYLDQYMMFPLRVKRLLSSYTAKNTLFVFTDHALGPWVPLVANFPHVIHCHDFLAQRSALDEVVENRTTATGKRYQAYIRRGFRQGKHFISVSQKTREDLHRFLKATPASSDVVYNGLNQSFKPVNPTEARILLSQQLNIDLTGGFMLHVGGNQWYKNRRGVILIYDAWKKKAASNIPLLMIGRKPGASLCSTANQLESKETIHWVSGVSDDQVKLAYAGALAFIFPSLAEGFGWPIAEAMASGCPVITTNEAPMTEVAGEAGFMIPKAPYQPEALEEWALNAAKIVDQVVHLTPPQRKAVVDKGIENASQFDTDRALDRIESIYLEILKPANK